MATASAAASDGGLAAVRHPQINITWQSAQRYVAWLIETDGKDISAYYRRQSGNMLHGPAPRRVTLSATILPSSENTHGSMLTPNRKLIPSARSSRTLSVSTTCMAMSGSG